MAARLAAWTQQGGEGGGVRTEREAVKESSKDQGAMHLVAYGQKHHACHYGAMITFAHYDMHWMWFGEEWQGHVNDTFPSGFEEVSDELISPAKHSTTTTILAHEAQVDPSPLSGQLGIFDGLVLLFVNYNCDIQLHGLC
jgi:hypothetical protein